MHIEERKVYVLVKDDGTEDIVDNPLAIEALNEVRKLAAESHLT